MGTKLNFGSKNTFPSKKLRWKEMQVNKIFHPKFVGKGRVQKKKLVEFSTKRLVEKNKKTKNYLRVMKRILYDMGPLTLG